MLIDDDFDMRLGEVIEKAVRRFTDKENKRTLTDDDCYMSVHVTKRGRIQLGFWRDNIDEWRPAMKFDLGALIKEQLEYVSQEDDWSFDPWRKALKGLLRFIDAEQRRYTKQYQLEHAGEAGKEDKPT